MITAMRRVFVDPDAPQRDAIQEAATWIRRGGVIAIPTDPATGEPIKTSNLSGSGGFLELASGWDDGRQDRGRPAAVGFAADGRLFLGDDIAGSIVWIAPVAP